jgi:hypothetical protein
MELSCYPFKNSPVTQTGKSIVPEALVRSLYH